ncbi:hypothetical protein NQL31_005262 [Lotmaria passim]
MQPPHLFWFVYVLAALLCGLLAATVAHADMFLASTTSYVPLTSIDQLQSVCQTARAGSAVQAMYSSSVITDVNEFMHNKSVTQAFVAAYYNTTGRCWLWSLTQMGEALTVVVDASQFVNNVLPDGTTGTFAIYSAADSSLQAVTGETDYQVLCYIEKIYYETKDNKFPWWGILIIVLGSVVIIAVVVTIVVCCCCCKKKAQGDDEDESTFSSRSSSSFSSRSSSFSGTSRSSSFSSRGSSFSGSSFSGSSKSSGVTGSTDEGSSSYMGSSSAASNSRDSSSQGTRTSGSQSSVSSSCGSSRI